MRFSHHLERGASKAKLHLTGCSWIYKCNLYSGPESSETGVCPSGIITNVSQIIPV